MENFFVLGRTVHVCECLQSGMALWFQCSRHQPDFVHFKHWLKQICTARIHDVLKLIVAGIIMETTVVQMGLVNLDWAPFIAHHKLLESEEAEIPTITLLIGHELGDGGWLSKHWSHLELPNASINITVSVEGSPVFEMFWLVCWHWVLSDVCNHVLVIH